MTAIVNFALWFAMLLPVPGTVLGVQSDVVCHVPLTPLVHKAGDSAVVLSITVKILEAALRLSA